MSDDGLLITSSPPRAEGLSLTVEGVSGERAEGLSRALVEREQRACHGR